MRSNSLRNTRGVCPVRTWRKRARPMWPRQDYGGLRLAHRAHRAMLLEQR